jgi:hypothetical protein
MWSKKCCSGRVLRVMTPLTQTPPIVDLVRLPESTLDVMENSLFDMIIFGLW